MAPTIILNGKKYTAKSPKMKLIKQCMHLQGMEGFETEAGYDEMINIIVSAFNHPEVTAEAVNDGMDLADLMPTINSIMLWVGELMDQKTAQFPNVQTPTA
jgi:hypothetical protein